MFKKLSVVIVLAVSASSFSYAGIFDQFANDIALNGPAAVQEHLDYFAKDLGALIGGGSYHMGANLGIPGFDVGVKVPSRTVNDKDVIVKSADLSTIALPVVQVEVGLPMKIDVIGRFMSYSGSSLTGAGLRYGIFKSIIPGIPDISVQAVYSKLSVNSDANKLEATNLNYSAVASISLPIVKPYLGVGMEETTLTPDSTLTALTGKASGMRIEGGVNLALIPLTYIQIGAAIVNDATDYTLGLGIKF